MALSLGSGSAKSLVRPDRGRHALNSAQPGSAQHLTLHLPGIQFETTVHELFQLGAELLDVGHRDHAQAGRDPLIFIHTPG